MYLFYWGDSVQCILSCARQNTHVEVRGQLARVGSLLLPCGSGSQAQVLGLAANARIAEPLAHFIGKLGQRSQDSPRPGV